jgi:hypothetical protein
MCEWKLHGGCARRYCSVSCYFCSVTKYLHSAVLLDKPEVTQLVKNHKVHYRHFISNWKRINPFYKPRKFQRVRISISYCHRLVSYCTKLLQDLLPTLQNLTLIVATVSLQLQRLTAAMLVLLIVQNYTVQSWGRVLGASGIATWFISVGGWRRADDTTIIRKPG